LELLLTVQWLKSANSPSKEGNFVATTVTDSESNSEQNLNLDSLGASPEKGSSEYLQLQLRIFRMTLALTVFSVIIFAIFLDLSSALSLFIGSLAGILYLRLLARGIGKLGKSSMSVSKVQLLVPVLLFFSASKFPQLELWPTFLGFLLYKPSLIIQFLLES